MNSLYIASIFIFVVFVLSILAIESKNILKSILFLSAASIFTAIIFVVWKAPDVAMTEAAIGAGFTTFLFFIAYFKVDKLEKEN
ncbi:MAG: DUF4040 domain-containing protein [Candidatus Mcinerneyibacterium aminivorans]|uniref:DUF4040 domain-containing protein n=1 Tax=Candidatus Mcinerneyibacterium aminivorans TaxID=2703815 RepID=A0A5D0MCF5_9BACT|nr:MAG: DUF4040 domain-containing protein [Candidatus Mcinerneyibacterium aminivorans]